MIVVDLYKIPTLRIIGAMRKEFAYSQLYKDVKEAALSDQKGPKGGKQYDCAACGKPHGSSHSHVDHIKPIIELDKSYKDYSLDTIADRMWCKNFDNPMDNLQVLCTTCHKTKTDAENLIRDENKRRAKLAAKAKTAKEKLPDSVSEEQVLKLFEDLGEDVVKKLTGAQLGDSIKKIVIWYQDLGG